MSGRQLLKGNFSAPIAFQLDTPRNTQTQIAMQERNNIRTAELVFDEQITSGTEYTLSSTNLFQISL